MFSCVQMTGQHQPVGPPSQTVHAAALLTTDAMRNQQTGITNNSYQSRTVYMGVQSAQNGHYNFQDGAYSDRQMSNWQTSAVPHQTMSSQQTAAVQNKNSLVKTLLLSGCLPEFNGYPATAQHHFHQNSAQNSKTQTPPKVMAAYSQQHTATRWNQPVTFHGKQSIRTQDGSALSPLYHGARKMYENENGMPTKQTKAYPSNITTATSLPREQMVCTRTLVSATSHKRPIANNQYHRQNVTQPGFSSSVLPTYSEAVTSISGQIQHDYGMSLNTQQYSAQLNTPPYNGREAAFLAHSFGKRTHGLPRRPTAGAPQQMLVCQNEEAVIIAEIADHLQKSYPADLDGHHPVYLSSPPMGRQLVRMECNQTMQPLTPTVAVNCNSKSSQLHSLQSLPNHVMSRKQLMGTSPQQSSVPDVIHDTTTGTTTGDRSRNGNKVDSALFRQRNGVLTGNVVGSSINVFGHILLPEGISPQRTETQSSVVNNQGMLEILERHPSVKQNDNSVYPSPSRTGARAVAVVQPLSQESYQVAIKQASSNTINQSHECPTMDKSLSNPEKNFSASAGEINKHSVNLNEGFPTHPHETRSYNCVTSHSAASNDGTVASVSDSVGPQHQLCAQKKGNELPSDQCVPPAVQRPVTSGVPGSQHCDMDKNEIPTETDPKTCVLDLFSIPTTTWTLEMLTTLIEDNEKAQESQCVRNVNSEHENPFWNGKVDLLMGSYKNVIAAVQELCLKYETPDSVILSEVSKISQKQLKSCHVLKDNDIYSELPYISSWLNVNERVDDIDKDFGYPWSLRHRLYTLESDSQPDVIEVISNIPAQNFIEVPNKVLPPAELESVDSGEMPCPNNRDSADSRDPFYSFQIKILTPEEAKVIFGQIQSKILQSRDSDSQLEEVMKSSVEDKQPDTRVTLSHSTPNNKVGPPKEGFCCLARWIETIAGSDIPFKCECKKEQCHKDCTEETLDKEEITAENDPILTIDLTEDDKEPTSKSDEETKNISITGTDDSQSSIIVLSDSEVEDLSKCEIPNQIPDFFFLTSGPEEECVQEQLISTGSGPSSNSDNSEQDVKMVLSSDCGSQMSDPVEERAQAEKTSTDAAESSLRAEEQTQIRQMSGLKMTIRLSGKHETAKRKWMTQCTDEQMSPFLKKSKKSRHSVGQDSEPVLVGVKDKVSVDASDCEHSDSNVNTVKLTLFGSKRQGKCVFPGVRKIPHSSPERLYHAVQRPPEFLSVNLKRKSSVHNQHREYSIKQFIQEKWRRSFVPTTKRRRRKLKAQQCTSASLSGVSLRKACSSNTKELPVSSDMIGKRDAKRCLSLKRRLLHSSRIKLGEENVSEDVVALKRHDQTRRDDENGNDAAIPLEENGVLNLCVLPSTFNTEDGSNRRKEAAGHVSDNADTTEGKRPDKTITGAKGTWHQHPVKKYNPLCPPHGPRTSGLFREFQKKYKKMQPSTDE
ncbi:uncharacterized protein si:ch211-106e7.2 [Scophthalmus maximus]|uniref:uncharacterized protein si:ch211-106e7.2 n=1 Tax=Scophthalmus maximus TaxID=52904 RepID=UPI001FA9365E|nr:uncharacterized protein si:ch211-106e7.2 [Scophthalmus maximus]